nr:double homeobox protein 4C-like [Loxodonta africana]
MDPTSAPSRSQNPRGRRERLVLKPSQRESLRASFEQNPYPGITTREELARETGIAEDRIQTWFANRRAGLLRKSRSASGQASEEEPSQGQGEPQPWSPENFPKAARRKRTAITTSQTSLLVEAFEENRYPGNEAKEELAQRTGLPRSRIHVWFQNRRARKPVQSASAPPKSLAESSTHAATLPLDQSDPSSVQSTYPLGPPSHPSSSNQAILPVLTESRPPFLPSEPSQGCAGQAPGAMMDQPALTVNTAETSHAPGTQLNQLPTGPTVGERLSDPQAPFWPQHPGNYQHRHQHAVSAGWLAQDPSRPDNSKTQWQVPAQQVTAPFTQWGCEVAQAGTARWEPSQETLQQPGHSEAHLWPEPAQSARGSSRPPDQDCQEIESLLDELLSAPELQGKSQSFLNADPQQEAPPQLQLSLGDLDFRALLDALQD